MSQSVTLLATLSLADSYSWPEFNEAATRLGAVAVTMQGSGVGMVEQLDHLAATGVERVYLVPVNLAEPLPTSWLGRVARWWVAHRPEAQLEVWYQTKAVLGLPTELPSQQGARRLQAKDSLTSPDWEQVPPVRRHVLVCRGPRCSAKGAAALSAKLGAELYRRDLLDTGVLVTQTGCMYPCNQAPVVVIQPDMEWLGPVGEDDVAALADRIEAACQEGVPASSRGVSQATD